MTDINVSVGLETSDALKESQKYIKSLNDVIEISERLQKQTSETNKALARQAKFFNSVATRQKDYTKAVNGTDSALNRMAARLSKVNGQTSRYASTLASSANTSEKLKKASDRVNASLGRQEKRLKNTNNLWQAAKRVALAYIGINTAKSVISTVSAFDSLNASLGIITGGDGAKVREQFDFITSTAIRLGLSVTDAGKEFIKLSAAAKGTSIEGQNVKEIFTGVSEAARALNLSADDTRGAFRAITQIMSKGTVQAEELRGQLGERFPGAFQTAARAVGATTAELNKMLEQGQVISEDFLPKFIKQLRQDIPLSAGALETVSAEFGKLGAVTQLLVKELGDAGLAQAVRDVTIELLKFVKSDAAKELAKNLGGALRSIGKGLVGLLSSLPDVASGFNNIVKAIKPLLQFIGLVVDNASELVKIFIAIKALAFADALAAMAVRMTALGTATGVAASRMALLLGSIVKIAAAFAIGFAIGEWLNRFEVVRLAGSFMVEFIILALERIKLVGDVVWTSLKNGAVIAFNKIRIFIAEKIAGISGDFASLLEAINFKGIFDGAIQSATDFGESFKGAAEGFQKDSDNAAQELLKLNDRIDESVRKQKALSKGFQDSRKFIRAAGKEVKSLTSATKKLADADAKAAAARARLNFEYEKSREANASLVSSLEKQSEALAKEIELLKLDADTRALTINLQKLSKDATETEIKLVTDLTAKIQEQLKAREKLKNAEKDNKRFLKDTQNLLKASDKLGDSWLRIGDNLEGAFGNIVDQLNALAIQEKQFTKQSLLNSTQLDKARENAVEGKKGAALDVLRLEVAQGDLENKNTQAKLGYLSAIAGATAKNFKEGSKATKALTILSQGLAVAQAVSAVANQGTGDPYTAFARIAAMIGTMASLGLTVGGGGGGSGGDPTANRQQTQGTGTVLGDAEAQSESIANALERLEEVDKDQFIELRGIFNEMVDLNRNITRFSAGLVKQFSDFSGGAGFDEGGLNLGRDQTGEGTIGLLTKIFSPIGGVLGKVLGSLFGSTKRTLIDSGVKFFSQTLGDVFAGGIDAVAFADIKTKKKKFFGLSSKTRFSQETTELDSELENQLTAIFTGMGNTISGALDILGIDAVRSLDSFVISLGEISLEGLSGEEIQAELEATFAQQGDLMAQHVLPSLVEFQKVGEGLFETLIRVAQETATFQQGLKLIGIGLGQFSDLSGEAFLKASQEAIDAAGGIEAYQAAVEKFSKEVLSSTSVLALATSNAKALSDVELADIGLTLDDIPDLDAFRAAFDEIKDSLSPSEIVEWIQAGNALADLDNAMDSFNETMAKMLKPFQDLRRGISSILADLGEDTRTLGNVRDRLSQARSAVSDLVGGDTGIINDGASRPIGQGINVTADPADQLAALKELKDAILENFDFQMMLIDEERKGIESLLAIAQEFKSSVDSFLGNIAEDIKSLEELAPDFDIAAARAGEVAALQDQLADAAIQGREEELALLGKLRSAILANFEAQQNAIKADFAERRKLLAEEMKARRDAIKSDFAARRGVASNTLNDLRTRHSTRVSQENELASLQDRLANARQARAQALNNVRQASAQAAFDAAQELFEAWNSAANELSDFLVDLTLSDFSPATNEERLGFAEGRFEDLLARAQGGDAGAAQQLAGASEDFLTEARDFFASGDQFTEIFNRVQEQVTGVRDIAAAVTAPQDLQIGDQAIVNGVAEATAELNNVWGEIVALKAIMEPLSTDELLVQIESQEELLQRLAEEEAVLLEALAMAEATRLEELAAAEALALETLRLETIEQLTALELRAEELNRLVSEEIVTHQDALLVLEERADELRQQTIDQLVALNSLVAELETARQNATQAEFDALIQSNSANANNIVAAINNSAASNSGSGGQGDGNNAGGPGRDFNTDPRDIFQREHGRPFSEMNATLRDINGTLRGVGGGAVFQGADQGIEVV